MSCNGTPTVERWWLGQSSWELRHWTGEGAFGIAEHDLIHNANSTHGFKNGFASDCDDWLLNLKTYVDDVGLGGIGWVGEIGVCNQLQSSFHYQARALDVTAIHFGNAHMDSNTSWRAGLEGKRLYVGIAAHLRRHFKTVLTGWWGGGHETHFHFDNGQEPGPIEVGDRDDTVIVQAACNFLNGESLTIDGSWGPATQDAYLRLITDFCMKDYDPKTNATHASIFFHIIALTGMDNRAAGAYQAFC